MLMVICMKGYCNLTFTHELAAYLLETKCEIKMNFEVFIPPFPNISVKLKV